MRIFLAKIIEDSNERLSVRVKAVDIEDVQSKDGAADEDSYIAISHVWGQPETITKHHVPGVGIVKLSPGKLDILNILNDRIPDEWFWMDLFCLNQSKNSTISMQDQLAAIPQIYKASRVVLVLIESPICTDWALEAETRVRDGVNDEQVFDVEEEAHSRKCQNMLIMDPWFERLWTRQEGLYSMKLRFLFLNKIACTRSALNISPLDKRQREVQTIAARERVLDFVTDKLSYHGIYSGEPHCRRICWQFLYRKSLDIGSLGGKIGPVDGYAPLQNAWRSARKTSKERDYVLAVFPDMAGYQVPPNPRNCTLEELLADAYTKLSRRGSPNQLLFRLTQSMVKPQMSHSFAPWVVPEPSDIGEALSCVCMQAGDMSAQTHIPAAGSPIASRQTTTNARFPVRIEPILIGDPTELESLIRACQSVVNLPQHVMSGPLMGSILGFSQNSFTETGQLHQLCSFIVGEATIRQWQKSPECPPEVVKQMQSGALISRGRPPLPPTSVASGAFEREARIFLTSFVCGIPASCAEKLLQHMALVRAVPDADPKRELIAVVNRLTLEGVGASQVVADFGDNPYLMGFALFQKREDLGGLETLVGRTMLPRDAAEYFPHMSSQRKQAH